MKNVVEDFEGYVIEVLEDTFWVRMYDLDEEEYQMELTMDKVLKDMEHLKEGIPCSLTFFSDETYDFHLIVEFWTKEQIDSAKEKAAEMFKKIKWLEEADD